MAEDSRAGSGPRTFYERLQALKALKSEQNAATAQKASGEHESAVHEPAVRLDQSRQLRPMVDAFAPTVKRSEANDTGNNEGLQNLHDRPAVKRTTAPIASPHGSSGASTGGVTLSGSGPVRSTDDQIERLKTTNLSSTSGNVFSPNKRAASSQLDPAMEPPAQPKTSSDTNTLVDKSALQFAPHLRGSRATTSPRVAVGPHATASPEVGASRRTTASLEKTANPQTTANSSVTAVSLVLGPDVTKGQVKGPHAAGTVASRALAPHQATSPQVTAPHRKMVKLNHEPDSAKPAISRSTILKSFGITSDAVADHAKVDASEEKENGHPKVEDSVGFDFIKTEDERPVKSAAVFNFGGPVSQPKDDGKGNDPTHLPGTASSSGSVEATRASAKKSTFDSTIDKESTPNNASHASVENTAVKDNASKKHALNGASNGTHGNGVPIGAAHSNTNGTDNVTSKPAGLTTVFEKFGLQEIATENSSQKLIQELEEIRGHQKLANMLLASYAERFSAMEWRIQELEKSTGDGELKSRALAVVVEFPSGQVLQLQTSPQMKMSELLHKVKSETGRDFVFCEFVHSNMALASEKRIGDYNIKAGDTLFLRSKSRGSQSAQVVQQ